MKKSTRSKFFALVAVIVVVLSQMACDPPTSNPRPQEFESCNSVTRVCAPNGNVDLELTIEWGKYLDSQKASE